jgi:hypothetical protein
MHKKGSEGSKRSLYFISKLPNLVYASSEGASTLLTATRPSPDPVVAISSGIGLSGSLNFPAHIRAPNGVTE